MAIDIHTHPITKSGKLFQVSVDGPKRANSCVNSCEVLVLFSQSHQQLSKLTIDRFSGLKGKRKSSHNLLAKNQIFPAMILFGRREHAETEFGRL